MLEYRVRVCIDVDVKAESKEGAEVLARNWCSESDGNDVVPGGTVTQVQWVRHYPARLKK